MVEFYEINGSEIISVTFESSYEDLKESFGNEGYWENLGLDEETYFNPDLTIGLSFIGYHEDSTVGSLRVQIHSEESRNYEEVDLERVSRISVERILEGKQGEAKNSVNILSEGAQKAEAD